MENLPVYVYVVFALTVVAAAWLFFKATHYSKPFLVLLVVWITLQSVLGIAGFYSSPDTMTARFPLLFTPALLFLISRLVTSNGRKFIDSLDLSALTLLNIIRLPVEIVLYNLYLQKYIPEAMTFHGRNFDIFSGITAPLIYYFGFVKKLIGYKVMLVWNFICLGLLVNVVSNALLSLPARYQQFGFEHPNVALGHFPFILLPAFLVPAVLISMVAGIRQLLKKKTGSEPGLLFHQ